MAINVTFTVDVTALFFPCGFKYSHHCRLKGSGAAWQGHLQKFSPKEESSLSTVVDPQVYRDIVIGRILPGQTSYLCVRSAAIRARDGRILSVGSRAREGRARSLSI